MSHITLKSYQQNALSTALPTAFDYEYIANGLLSEVGEVLGKYAKAHRDQKSREWLLEELVKEYGDVCWPTAVGLHMEGIDEIREGVREYVEIMSNDDPVEDLVHWSVELWYEYSQRKHNPRYASDASVGMKNALQRLWVCLESNCEAITGHSFDYVLGANTAKLTSRQDRGVLEGSGDNR